MFAEEISFYKLIKKIGSGGMGEVYLAEDTRLSRKVALKVLPAEFAQDRKRLSRFLQEARLAANLNHPNICIIYEVNDAEDVAFIAMEYLEGETLAQKVQNNDLDLERVIDYAAQIADALDEAHHQGIIHRDIKSANVIISRRGLVKILDFGLAKTIIENVSEEAVTQAKTEAGVLVGTVQYMSPEHAMGKNPDGRTDLWSVGVLLYEMVTGESPFKGNTQVAIFDEILHKDATPPSELNENIPTELEKIILKLLEKDRDFRYQTASDLHADLRRLQRQSRDTIKARSNDQPFSFEKISQPKTEFFNTQTDELPAQKTSDTVLPESKVRSQKYLWGALALILALIGISFGIYKYLKTEETFISFDKRENQRLTNLGDVADARISADGRYLVYVQDEGSVQSLWLKQIATGSVVQVIQPSNVVFQGVAISPDSTWIYYNVWDKQGVGEIFRVPVLGGIPQLVIHDVMPGVEISPDNQKIAFVRSYDAERENRLIAADLEGHHEDVITKRNRDEGIIPTFIWSPDSKTLAILSTIRDGSGELPTISEISPVEKKEIPIWTIPEKLRNFTGGLIWQPDKKGLLITLAEQRNPYSQIWQISYPAGEAKQLTKNLNTYSRLSVTDDGRNLISIQVDSVASLWVVPADKPADAQKITSGKIEGLGVNWTPDGRILYGSTIGGNVDIWMSDADGSHKRQLTSDPNFDSESCLTAGGNKIVFASNRNNGNWNLWTMNLDGSNQKQLIQKDSQWSIVCSKLENSIYYWGNFNNEPAMWKMSLDGGESQLIFNKQSFRAALSPDEKYLAYSIWDESKKQMVQEIFTIATGETRQFKLPITAIGEGQSEPSVKWTPDGKNFSFINAERGTNNIWIQPVKGGKPTKVTDFKEYSIYNYSWSDDGKKLVLMRGTSNRDVVLMSEKK
jgi:serine/threonine protein kinase